MPPKGHASLAGVAVFFLWSGVQKRRRVRLAASYSCATGMLAVSPAPREESSSSSAFPGRDLNMSPQTSSGPPPGPLDISEESRSRFRVVPRRMGARLVFRVAPAASGPCSVSGLCVRGQRLIHPLFAVDWGTSLPHLPHSGWNGFPAFDLLSALFRANWRDRITPGGGWNSSPPGWGDWGIRRAAC